MLRIFPTTGVPKWNAGKTNEFPCLSKAALLNYFSMKEDVKKYLAEIGQRGGKKGGKAKSEAKRAAAEKSLKKARAKRWPKRKKTR